MEWLDIIDQINKQIIKLNDYGISSSVNLQCRTRFVKEKQAFQEIIKQRMDYFKDLEHESRFKDNCKQLNNLIKQIINDIDEDEIHSYILDKLSGALKDGIKPEEARIEIKECLDEIKKCSSDTEWATLFNDTRITERMFKNINDRHDNCLHVACYLLELPCIILYFNSYFNNKKNYKFDPQDPEKLYKFYDNAIKFFNKMASLVGHGLKNFIKNTEIYEYIENYSDAIKGLKIILIKDPEDLNVKEFQEIYKPNGFESRESAEKVLSQLINYCKAQDDLQSFRFCTNYLEQPPELQTVPKIIIYNESSEKIINEVIKELKDLKNDADTMQKADIIRDIKRIIKNVTYNEILFDFSMTLRQISDEKDIIHEINIKIAKYELTPNASNVAVIRDLIESLKDLIKLYKKYTIVNINNLEQQTMPEVGGNIKPEELCEEVNNLTDNSQQKIKEPEVTEQQENNDWLEFGSLKTKPRTGETCNTDNYYSFRNDTDEYKTFLLILKNSIKGIKTGRDDILKEINFKIKKIKKKTGSENDQKNKKKAASENVQKNRKIDELIPEIRRKLSLNNDQLKRSKRQYWIENC